MASTFSYTARAKDGSMKEGQLSAADRQGALSALSAQGLVPVLIKESTGNGLKMKLSLGSLPGLDKLGKTGKVKTKEKVIFSRQFATMINAGVPVAQSLAVLERQSTSPKLKQVIGQMAKKVEGGTSLSGALAEHPSVFPPVYVNMVKAGEAGGMLDQVLDRLATQQEKDAEIVGKVKGASIYPGVITAVTIGAFIFLMTVIVPKLSAIFEQFGDELPVYTRVMLGISDFLIKYNILILVAAVIGAFALMRFIKTPRGKQLFDRLIIKAPIIGPIVIKVNIARFARTFGSLMSAGLAVLDALHVSAQALNNSVFRAELEAVAAEVKNGKAVSEPLKHSHNFPPIVAQMISVGEETGQIDKILLKVAEFYEKEVDSVVSNLTSVIEPILIIVLGTMVGSVVLSVFGPIAQLTDTIAQ